MHSPTSPASTFPHPGSTAVSLPGSCSHPATPSSDSPCGENSAGLPDLKTPITYWKEADGKYLGYLNSHPEHWTQGSDLDDLKAHLRDLHALFTAEEVPGIRQVVDLGVG